MLPEIFSTVVVDVDGGITPQAELLGETNAQIVQLPHTDRHRYWSEPDDFDELLADVTRVVHADRIPAIFYGSGDYHHLALLGLNILRHSPVLIVFDNHTDWWSFPRKRYYMGSWVAQAVDENLVNHVLMLGVDGDLGMTSSMPFPMGEFSHRLDLVASGKIETYSRTVEETSILGRFEASNPAMTFVPGIATTTVKWKPFRNESGLLQLVEDRLAALPSGPVYISVDKDVLTAVENFSAYGSKSGQMTVAELTAAIELICERRELLGIDVCGDGSKTREFASLAKEAMSAIGTPDHTDNDYASSANAELNSKVNLAILNAAKNGIERRSAMLTEA